MKYLFISNVFLLVLIAAISLTWSQFYGYQQCMQENNLFIGTGK